MFYVNVYHFGVLNADSNIAWFTVQLLCYCYLVVRVNYDITTSHV